MRCTDSVMDGYVKITVTGCSCERFFNLCVNHDIGFTHIIQMDGGCSAHMRAADFLKIKRIAKKCRVCVRIQQKCGVPFFLKQYRKHKMMMLGWIWCCFFIYLLSLRIWKIEIYGNQEITRMQIMEYLSERNISYGTRKKQIDCKQTAADLRNTFPEVTWVAIKKQGTVLEIDVKENTDKTLLFSKQKNTEDQPGSSLVSEYDGKVIAIFTRSGVPEVKAGDTVKKGDLLVSGIIPVTNDENEVIKNQLVNADADITIEISDTYTEQFSRKVLQTTYIEKEKTHRYLKIFHKMFSFWKPDRHLENTEMIVKEHQLSFFSDFYISIYWGIITVRPYKKETILLSEEDSKEIANNHLNKFLSEKEEKGVQILKKNVRIETGMTICKCICNYQAYISETKRIPAMQMEESEE